MCYRDRNNVAVFINDIVECNGIEYCIKFIESYPCATVVVVEDIKTHVMDTLLLRDVKKL